MSRFRRLLALIFTFAAVAACASACTSEAGIPAAAAVQDLKILGACGRGEREAGQFIRPHGMDVDSRGTVCVGEASTGYREQKFVPGETGR